MNRKQIESRWLQAIARLKSTWTKVHATLNGEWLAKLRLKDQYAKKRPSS
jgi:hypothetical protein